MQPNKINLRPVTPGFEEEIAQQAPEKPTQPKPSEIDNRPQQPIQPLAPAPYLTSPMPVEPDETKSSASSIVAILILGAIGLYNIVIGAIAFFNMFNSAAGESTQVVRNLIGFFGFCSMLFGIGLIMRKGFARKILIALQVLSIFNVVMSIPKLIGGAGMLGAIVTLTLSVGIIAFLSSRTVKDIFTS